MSKTPYLGVRERNADAVRLVAKMSDARTDRIAGCLVGTAVGDALGLPREGLSRARAQKLFGARPLRQRLLLGRGMLSDDTAHAELTYAAYLRSKGDPDRFRRTLASELRQWFLTFPPGIGLATLKSCLKLCAFVSPDRSGANSAGNGPCMRAPILGVLIDDPEELDRFVEISTRVTHTHRVALDAARIVAHLTHLSARRELGDVEAIFGTIEGLQLGDPWVDGIQRARRACQEGVSTNAFLDSLGLERGVTGYSLHTALAAVYCCARNLGEFRSAVEDAVLAGGDSDTLGAIVGGICGARGLATADEEWRSSVFDWPSVRRLEMLSSRADLPAYWVRNPWPVMLGRNVVLFGAVIGHAGRRVLPPY